MKAFILLFWVVWTLGAVAQEEKNPLVDHDGSR